MQAAEHGMAVRATFLQGGTLRIGTPGDGVQLPAGSECVGEEWVFRLENVDPGGAGRPQRLAHNVPALLRAQPPWQVDMAVEVQLVGVCVDSSLVPGGMPDLPCVAVSNQQAGAGSREKACRVAFGVHGGCQSGVLG